MAKRRDTFAKRRGITLTRLLARDGDRCPLCAGKLDRKLQDPGDPSFVTIDHIRPRVLGGSDEISNLRLAHRICNQRRGDAYDPEFDAPARGAA